MEVNIFFIFLISLIKFTSAKLYLDPNWKYPLDQDLYERVLDPEQCEKQLNYIRKNDSFLQGKFIEAGLRVPRGIFLGNLKDYGNYPQCLGIHEVSSDMTINGKYCLIKVPANQNVQIELLQDAKWDFNPNMLQLNDEMVKKLEDHRTYMKTLRSALGETDDSRLDLGDSFSNMEFQLAVCIPKVCTTQEAFSGLLYNITGLGFKYEDDYCRLPNDKPWVAADYIAIVVFSILGLLTLLSTSYDVHHNVISKKDPKEASVILISFSAYTNCRRLLSFKANPNAIECLDGIRALATFWVVVGHTFFAFHHFVLNRFEAAVGVWIITANLTVDTFFLISGLLLVYTTARKLTANQLIKSLPIFYLNRLLRMFPVLAAAILFEASFYNRLGDGPVWNLVLGDVQKCRTFWWSTLLHVQNFVIPEQPCIGVTWYLAIDTILHILSPIILFFVLGRTTKMALSAVAIGVIVSMTVSVAYIYAKEFSDENFSHYTYYYVNVLTRAPPFFIGLVYGYILFLWHEKRARIPRLVGNIMTAWSIALIGVVVYCKYLQNQPDFVGNGIAQDTFDSFLRPSWSLGLGWIIFACVNGYGGPINWFLSLNVWKIPSRISYAMYLFHTSLMIAYYSTSLQPLYFTAAGVMFEFMAFFAIVLQISFLITALIDAPFANLFKLFLTHGSKKSQPERIIKEVNENSDVSVIENIENPVEKSTIFKQHKL